jgi:hypothetical protein
MNVTSGMIRTRTYGDLRNLISEISRIMSSRISAMNTVIIVKSCRRKSFDNNRTLFMRRLVLSIRETILPLAECQMPMFFILQELKAFKLSITILKTSNKSL